ncbi:IMP3 [Symbiodinium sp. KB8]|nr:IMP3 [Symbiodinium sp. KB8]
MAAATPDEAMLQRVLGVAKAAAQKAGDLMRANKGAVAVAHTKDGDKDLVTVVDKQCEDVVRATIQEAFPDHAVLGEESVGSGSSASAAALESFLSQEWLWIVDPIDGTTNFVHGIPASVVSIGVAHQGTMVAGVVLDPFREELFSATAGGGAHCNGEPITVSAAEKGLAQAVLAFGTGHEAEMAQTMCAGAGAVSPHCRSVRSFGSAALHLSWVACGRLTGFWELDLSSWDVSAGGLLVVEAGGRISDTRGQPYTLRTRDMVATTGVGDIHSGLLESLKSAGAHVVPFAEGNVLFPPEAKKRPRQE